MSNEHILTERQRIEAILNNPEGKKRPESAKQLAFDTNMSPEAAAAFLAKLPAEKAASSIETAMAEVGPLGIRSAHMGGGHASTGDAKADRLAEMRRNLAPFAAYRKGQRYVADINR